MEIPAPSPIRIDVDDATNELNLDACMQRMLTDNKIKSCRNEGIVGDGSKANCANRTKHAHGTNKAKTGPPSMLRDAR